MSDKLPTVDHSVIVIHHEDEKDEKSGLFISDSFFVDISSELEKYAEVTETARLEKENRVDEIKARTINKYQYEKTTIQKDRELINGFFNIELSKKAKAKDILGSVKLRTKMAMSGVKEPKKVLSALELNPNIYSVYNISDAGEIESIDYTALSHPKFLSFLANFDNPDKMITRLSLLKVEVPVHLSGLASESVQKEIVSLLKVLEKIPSGFFSQFYSELETLYQNSSISILNTNGDINRDFLAMIDVLQSGKLSSEFTAKLKKVNSVNALCGTKIKGLKDVVTDPESLDEMEDILSELSVSSSYNNRILDRFVLRKIWKLDEMGLTDDISSLLKSGLVFRGNSFLSSKFVSHSKVSFFEEFNPEDPLSQDSVREVITRAIISNKNPSHTLIRVMFGLHAVEDVYLVEELAESVAEIEKVLTDYILPKVTAEFKKIIMGNRDAVFLSGLKKRLENASVGNIESIGEDIKIGIDIGDWQCDPKAWLQMIQEIGSIINDLIKDSEFLSELPKNEDPKERPRRKIRPDILTSFDKRRDKRNRERSESVDESGEEMKSIESFSIDKGHVVDQNLDVVYLGDDKLLLQLKIDPKRADDFSVYAAGNSHFNSTRLGYGDIKLSEAYEYSLESGAVSIKISTGKVRSGEASHNDSYSDRQFENNQEFVVVHTTQGLVNIEVDLSKTTKTYRELIEEIEPMLSYIAGISEEDSVFADTDAESDELLRQRLAELNTKGIDPGDVERRKVFEDYSTLTVPGRSKELQQKYGKFVSYHSIQSGRVGSILRNGLTSSHERYKRGLLVSGLSTSDDFYTGGADNVFLRTISDKQVKDGDVAFSSGIKIIFKPELWDRLDFYIYDQDNFGSRAQMYFSKRLSPDEYLQRITKSDFNTNNEQMFQKGISVDMIAGLFVPRQAEKEKLCSDLKAQGIFEVNGIKIEDFIVAEEDREKRAETVMNIAYPEESQIQKEESTDNEQVESVEQLIENNEQIQWSKLFEENTSTMEQYEILRQNETLRKEFDNLAHVSEGFTIGEHTMMVLSQLEKYYLASTTVGDILTEQEYKVGLFLHDIGKHRAYKIDGGTDKQHFYTKQMMEEVLPQLGLSVEKTELLTDVFSQDYIGEYLGPKKVSLTDTVQKIKRIADKHVVDLVDMLTLMDAYYMSDASSYTKDATGKDGYLDQIGLFEKVDGVLLLGSSYKDKYEVLLKAVINIS